MTYEYAGSLYDTETQAMRAWADDWMTGMGTNAWCDIELIMKDGPSQIVDEYLEHSRAVEWEGPVRGLKTTKEEMDCYVGEWCNWAYEALGAVERRDGRYHVDRKQTGEHEFLEWEDAVQFAWECIR